MGLLHLGQGLVLARIQFMFSLSALFLVSHVFTVLQDTCRRPHMQGQARQTNALEVSRPASFGTAAASCLV